MYKKLPFHCSSTFPGWFSLQSSASSSSLPSHPLLLLRTRRSPADPTCCGWCLHASRRFALCWHWCRWLSPIKSMAGNTPEQDGKAKRQDMTGAAAVGEEDAPEHLFLRWFQKNLSSSCLHSYIHTSLDMQCTFKISRASFN